MAELNWTDVDEVTTIWADAPPPLRAGLLFRTGRVDETLVTAGQTHLIEHLALAQVDITDRRHNGFVGGVVSGFLTIGQDQEVSSFLSCICESLVSLPSDRLESEKQILAAENATRQYDFRSNLLTRRYGITGWGLVNLPELGLRKATIEQLHHFSTQRFTKENAVLWLSGPPPSGLRLNLPHGMKQPIPSLAPIQPTFPSWFVDDKCGGVAAGATVPRVSAATIFCEIADRRLREQLRTVKAVSYAPTVFYDHLNADIAHLVLYADSDQDHRKELVSVFGEVFEGIGKFDASEVETSQQRILEIQTGALAPSPMDLMVIDVQRAAMDWIFGREFASLEALRSELITVTASDVSGFGSDIKATAMIALPGGTVLQPWMGKQALLSTAPAVHGRETLCIDAPIKRERLVHGPDGVSVMWPDGSCLTVRYSELAAALYYEDGGLQLVGSDATLVIVEPTLWRNGQNICRSIREQVPEHLLLNQGSRSADTIPKPSTTMWQRFREKLGRGIFLA